MRITGRADRALDHAVRRGVRRLASGVALLATLLCVAVPAEATEATEAMPYGYGVLWKVETRGRAPNYVFGTIHLSDPRVIALPAPVRKALDEVDNLSLELDFAMWGDHDARMLRLPPPKRLSAILGDELYGRVRGHVRKDLAEMPDFDRLKPWVVMLALTRDPGTVNRVDRHGRPTVDLLLRQLALARGILVFGLETNEEQINVFDRIPLAAQVDMIRSTLDELGGDRSGQIERMVQRYLARDLAGLMDDMRVPEDDTDGTFKAFHKRLLDDRNRVMVRRMHHLLREGGSFVGVGAGHLPGENGVLNLLARRGYKVERIY